MIKKYKLWFLVSRVDAIPLDCCYAVSVSEARKMLGSQVGFIVGFYALGDRVRIWADLELSSCPLYELGKKGFFESKVTQTLIPLVSNAKSGR